MSNLIKIKDISARYDITARTMRYYEDMGLITSTRADDYAYRLYDEAAVIRLEQILILRKLNISIKDIQRIFNTTGSGVVLDILNKKIQNIDDEVALLHELKDIVLDFIREIERIDFTNDTNIKLLYDKAKEIETHMANVDYIGKPSNMNRLIEITEKLDKKIPDIMIINLPKCRVMTSGVATFGDFFGGGIFNNAMGWMWNNKDLLTQNFIFDSFDFLCTNAEGAEYIAVVNDGVTEAQTEPYKIIDFPGGFYAVAVTTNDDESREKVRAKTRKWLETTNFEFDGNRKMMTNVIYECDEILNGLGYHQLNNYMPIKLKEVFK